MIPDPKDQNNPYHEDSDEIIESESKEIINPEELIDEIEKASFETDELNTKFADATTKTGFAKASLDRMKDYVIKLIQSEEDPVTYNQVINTLGEEVRSYREEIGQVTIDSSPMFLKVDGLTSTAYSMVTTSGSLIDSINPTLEEDLFVPYQFKPNSEEIKTAFTTIDPSLFDIYKEIEEILYNTRADNIKMALAATRQTFDHFFHILAPDELVRASKYWEPKTKTDKPNQIYRIERIQYAIGTHVKDTFRAQTLLASAKNIIATYELLNDLHTRGRVNINSTKKAIYTVVHFMEEIALEIEK